MAEKNGGSIFLVGIGSYYIDLLNLFYLGQKHHVMPLFTIWYPHGAV